MRASNLFEITTLIAHRRTYIKLGTLVTAATAILARHKSSQKIGDENEERAERTVVYHDMDGLYKLHLN